MRRLALYISIVATVLLAACSTTSSLPDDEVLYAGIARTTIEGKQGTSAESVALEEVEGALAYAPNGAFLGSSSVRTPFPIGLWLYNSLANKQKSAFNRWLFNSFATEPVTISRVSPLTRTRVATNLLQNYGYMNGEVDYELINTRNPRKQKIAYTVRLGQPFVYDSIRYEFPVAQDSIVQKTMSQSLLRRGGQFSTYDLTNEKARLVDAFHDNGFYYYRPDYINYFADTVNHPKHVSLLVQQDKDAPTRAQQQFHIGTMSTYIRKSPAFAGNGRRDTARVSSVASPTARRNFAIHYDDSLVRNGIKVAYQGDRLPINERVLFRNFRFWRRGIYNQSKVNQTLTNLHNMNIFSNVRMTFTPRDTTATCDTLDMRLDCTMDKLIDAELDFNITQKSNSQIGPHLGLTFSKRNAFHHGETFSVGLKGSYEWQTVTDNADGAESERRIDSYESGMKVSLTYPWIVIPLLDRVNKPRNIRNLRSVRRLILPSSTEFALDINQLNRSSYFRTVTSELEATCKYRTGQSWSHEFTLLSLAYRKVLRVSDAVQELMNSNAYIHASMQEQFIPAMRYSIAYDNTWNKQLATTTHAELSVKEASNVLNGVNAILGFDYHERDKKLLFTPYSQFLKTQFTLKNHFRLTKQSELATRVQLGMVWSYGNSTAAPFSELFYVGGANSIRAFAVRSIGPGSYYDRSALGAYVYQTGDFKLELNAEYRFPLVSDLYGALFVDAGNVWLMRTNEDTFQQGAQLKASTFFDQLALGTGLGLRYDLQFLVLRLDCGIGIHAPYDTGRHSYYNIRRFSDGLGIHFAVGYPF